MFIQENFVLRSESEVSMNSFLPEKHKLDTLEINILRYKGSYVCIRRFQLKKRRPGKF